MERIQTTSDLKRVNQALAASRDSGRPVVTVCGGTGCNASGARMLVDELAKVLGEKGLVDQIGLRCTGCHGFCERGPLVVIHPEMTFYHHVQLKDAADVVESVADGGKIVDRLLFKGLDGVIYEKEEQVPFYKHQMRVIFAQNGLIDPTCIEDYLALGGYTALAKVIDTMTPGQVIDTIIKSGLRGRGGGGFPAGVKWKTCRDAGEHRGEQKRYVICNADEGDPGAFMDRSLLEGNPHSVIEGMIIGAFAIGSDEGVVYVRNEYPLAVHNLNIALAQAREAGLLGERILGSNLSFDIRINRGGGAFVCGESTALMASIEGFVGEPRAKHIHTVEAGLYEKPTNLNNVETWANVPPIINRGVEWYTSIGTGDVSKDPWGGSKGTKIFSLVGKVNHTGLVEVPMGMTLRQIIYEVGGGIKDGGEFKAVQTGGPSGGCLPAKHLDVPVDFDELTRLGSMMGSGGMIVMDEKTCMVDVAKYFTAFLADESCGKCVSCREGLRRTAEVLGRITGGEGKPSDIALLEQLAEAITDASLCALGTTAANPLLSTLTYFREEYVEHISKGRCRAKVCKPLIRFTIADNCNGCHSCFTNCPVGAVSGEVKEMHTIDQAKCTKCGICHEVCKFDSVHVE